MLSVGNIDFCYILHILFTSAPYLSEIIRSLTELKLGEGGGGVSGPSSGLNTQNSIMYNFSRKVHNEDTTKNFGCNEHFY